MTFQDVALLQDGLAELQSNAEVRRLLSLVPQDAQNETIDLAAAPSAVLDKGPTKIETKLALIAMRKFLQNVFYFMVGSGGTELANAFLYENHTRLQKLLVVAKLHDHANLQSFGTPEEPVWPMTSDMPTYTRLWTIIHDFRLYTLADMHERNDEELAVMPEDFKYLCPEDDRESFRQRCPN